MSGYCEITKRSGDDCLAPADFEMEVEFDPGVESFIYLGKYSCAKHLGTYVKWIMNDTDNPRSITVTRCRP